MSKGSLRLPCFIIIITEMRENIVLRETTKNGGDCWHKTLEGTNLLIINISEGG